MDLSGLSPEQRAAVEHSGSPLLVLAGAGSGKTRVLTYRIAHIVRERGVEASRVFAVTFTNKAAGEMRERVSGLLGASAAGLWLGTFHATCARLLRAYGERIGVQRSFVIFDDKDSLGLVREVMAELHIPERMYPPKSIAGCLDGAKNAGLGPEAYARAEHDAESERAARVYPLYQKALAKQNALDFGDLILRTVDLFKDDAARGAELTRRWRHVLVDEFQDTNGAQYALLRALAKGGAELCVVGDDDQSIYGWRGAELRNILEFPKDFPGTRIVTLGNNYRSAAAIVHAASTVIGHNRNRHEKRLFTENAEGERPRYVRLRDERDEARHVAAEVERLCVEGDLAYREAAVIYRTNAQSRVVEDALRERRIPHRVLGGVRFYERKEVRDVLGYLRLVLNRESDVDFRRVVNVPSRGLGAATLSEIESRAKAMGGSLFAAARALAEEGSLPKRATTSLRGFVQLVDKLDAESKNRRVGNFCRFLLDETGYRKALLDEKTAEARARLENIEELVSAAEEFELEMEEATLATFLEGAALVSDTDQADDSNMVSLMTVHSAKGLEFRAVFLTGLEEGTFPHSRSTGHAEVEEERRLLYVGMTRAKETLCISSVAVRRLFGEAKGMAESRFAGELGDAVLRENLVYEEVVPDGVSFYTRRRAQAENRDDDFVDPIYDDDQGGASSFASRRRPSGFTQSRPPARSVPTRSAPNARGASPSHDDFAHGSGGDDVAPMGPRKGMRVSHALFGQGRVEAVSGSGKDCKLSVRFENGAQKTIVAKFVTLLGY